MVCVVSCCIQLLLQHIIKSVRDWSQSGGISVPPFQNKRPSEVWQKCLCNRDSLYAASAYSIGKLPETAWADPDRGRGVGSFFICHTFWAWKMFEEEVKILLRGLKGQLVQQLLGRRGLGRKSGEGGGKKQNREVGSMVKLQLLILF